MSFPTDPIDLTVEIAPAADPSADPATWTWVDISSYVRITDSIVNARGKQSPLSATVPASLSLLVDNTGGRFVPSNPIGSYYPLRRNCPIRFSIDPGTGSVTRLTGFVDAWPPRWDVSGNNVWVPLNAHGLTRRLATAGRSAEGALRRYIVDLDATTNLIAYWSLEDGSDAKSAASSVAGVPPLSVKGSVRFGSTAPLSGVTSMVDPSGGYLAASIPSPGYALEWRLEFVAVWEAAWSTNQRPISWLTPGSVKAWNVVWSTAGLHLDGYSTDVALVTTQVVDIDTAFVPVPGQLHHIRIDTTMSGTTMQVRMYVDGTQYGSTASLLSSATLPPSHLRINPDSINTDDTPLMGHLAIWAPPPTSDTATVALGRVGETAGDRMVDLSAESGVAIKAISSAASTEKMGPPPAGSYLQVMRDCEATDGGLLFEAVDGPLKYVPRVDLCNQTVALTVDYSLGQVQPPFNPSVDDAQLANDITAKRPSGSEAHHVDQTHIDTEGRYEDTLAVNPQDDARLQNMAAWAVRKGTLTEQRFDNLAISLSRSPELIADWLACDIGSRIQVTNVPSELQPDTVDLILVGYQETIDYPRGWRVDMVCEPAAPYTVGVRDTDRRDTAGSELAVANTSAQATDTSAARNYIVIPDVSAAGFAVGDRVVLHDSDGYRKEPGVFTVTSKASAFGFTNVSFTPPAQDVPTGVFAGAGDTIRRVDQTSLLVATTLGQLWTTSAAQMPIDVGVSGERLTVSNIDSSVRDTFSRTVSGGWGTAESGQVWSVVGTASEYAVVGGTQARMSLVTANDLHMAHIDCGSPDHEVVATVAIPVVPTGSGISVRVAGRLADTANYYEAQILVAVGGAATLQISRRVAGAGASVTSGVSVGTHAAGNTWAIKLACFGTSLQAKAWKTSDPEPDGWAVSGTDTSLTAGTRVGGLARRESGNTNGTVNIDWPDFYVLNPQTFTVTRAINGVEKAHSAGAAVSLWNPARRAL